MDEIFGNAIKSLQLGLEDYQANDQKRSLSAVRNFYAGTLLLAKAALISRAPKADPAMVLAARYKPAPDGMGGLAFLPSEATIDFDGIGQRFKAFGLNIDHASLRELNRIRNDAEHRYSAASHTAVREAISQAFPVVVQMFDELGEQPHAHLGDCWKTMLGAKELFDKELAQCQESFDQVRWRSDAMRMADKTCPQCASHLVYLKDGSSPKPDELECSCRQCGAEIELAELYETTLEDHFGPDLYSAAKDGDQPPLMSCNECNLFTYVLSEEENACAYCGHALEECEFCTEPLTPSNVSPDSNHICDYCAYKLSKDD